ncbi:hypothetical protein BBP00_00002484 [Phytophthora kernoviae]|uniref:Uncharacterized protein n=1 Tax=Phytophthora kernoviae TaxID=325452 RepID=A0A3F2RY53_9STRA|nr:hypothetical protein BBP00_00002484 [Phytophthora kernoviae]
MAAAAAASAASMTTVGSSSEPPGSARTALIIDGSYALIGGRNLGGKIDYVKLRSVLEEQATTQFGGRFHSIRAH